MFGRKDLFDVILMDAVMPVMDFFTACARMQELPGGSAIPVLMITALEDNSSVERAFAAGASDYIPKPIHYAVLSQRVRRIIEANRAEKRIRHLAYNDLLTGRPNRTLFFDLLGQAVEQAQADQSVLVDTGLPPHLLELEITESTLMEQAHDTLQALHRLRALGVRLSNDDFGTGYSSLSYLKRFPVDIIKIDRTFVRDVPQDADDAAIIAGIVALAHSLRLEVVAEGVETEAQLNYLRAQYCDMLQGYYLSRPVPAAQFAALVHEREARLLRA